MDKRREALKKIVEAKKRIRMTEEEREEYIDYYYKYEYQPEIEIDTGKYEGDCDQKFITLDVERDVPTKSEFDEYHKWKAYAELEKEEGRTLSTILSSLTEPTLEEAAEIISNEGMGASDEVLDRLFSKITNTSSPELGDNDGIYKFMKKYGAGMAPTNLVSILGDAYGKLGIPVDKLPEIVLQDTYFLKGYLYAFPANEKDILRKGNSEYIDIEYTELYDLVERAQSEIDLRHEKDVQDTLKERTKTISEAEAIVNQQQDQQQE